jgi:hypothetical protein
MFPCIEPELLVAIESANPLECKLEGVSRECRTETSHKGTVQYSPAHGLRTY